jgi:hypothetical protein
MKAPWSFESLLSAAGYDVERTGRQLIPGNGQNEHCAALRIRASLSTRVWTAEVDAPHHMPAVIQLEIVPNAQQAHD